MLMTVQIFLIIISFVSFVFATGGEDKAEMDRNAKFFGLSIAALMVTLFFMEGGLNFP